MTVRELFSVLDHSHQVQISWDGTATQICPYDNVILDAFGDFKVKKVYSYEENEFLVEIAVRPIKEERAT